MSCIEKEKLIKADIASIENRVRHAFNQGYDLGYKEGKERAKSQEPTTKNDLGVDCVARQDVERYIEGFINEYTPEEELEFINLELDGLKHLTSVTPQEPFKPMVEIDLDYVIKQKYIEREVLDKIRAEITDCLKALDEIEKSGLNIYLPNEISGRRLTYQQCLEFIDKYKTESEPQEREK